MVRRWINEPTASTRCDDGTVSFAAGARTDWFRDPRTAEETANAPFAVVVDDLLPVTVSCVVEVDHRARFDAGALFVHANDDRWVKLAVERDPDGVPRIVSVRTDGCSDDCNHMELAEPRRELRVSVDARSIALHARASADQPWMLIRYCPWTSSRPPAIGLLVQSPTGEGTAARFSSIVVEPRAVVDLRNGS